MGREEAGPVRWRRQRGGGNHQDSQRSRVDARQQAASNFFSFLQSQCNNVQQTAAALRFCACALVRLCLRCNVAAPPPSSSPHLFSFYLAGGAEGMEENSTNAWVSSVA
ncbi:hypothetical protein XENORESO_008729 [Xenotaenia resolanae]|uniref:Uncharacterized protein n=1 Tax=Xenotaenia resolanae TaxID=208358 RepID=A0ABV0W6G4_9TELE